MIKVRERADGHKAITASLFAGARGISQGISASGTSQSISHLLGADVKSSMLQGIIEEDERQSETLQGVYRDIYYHDHLSGAAVDLKASLPWSDFTLVGVEDERAEVFYENIERLNMKSLHVPASVDHMVTGAFIGMLVYNPALVDKGFTDIMPFDYSCCDILPVPLYSQDPVITLRIDEEMKRFANDESDDAKAAQRNMPPEMLQAMKDESAVDLDSLSTLYLPRTTMSTMQTGVSIYRRILPLWLLERVLYRGTMTEATRRQKSTLHITVGDENWVPTDDELANYLKTFQETEQDPISSYVATVAGVQTQDILPPASEWRWNDSVPSFNEFKLMALGVSTAFLQGDTSVTTQDMAISTFIEMVAAYRRFVTWKIYYGKLFPMIARLNDFYADDSPSKETSATREVRRLQNLQIQLNETRKLEFPKIQWHKTLRPEADREQLDMMQSLREFGVPIPLRHVMAVGGMDQDQVLKDLEGEKEFKDKVKKLKPPPANPEEGEEGEGGFGPGGFASLEDGPEPLPPPRETASLANVLTRPYREEDREFYATTKTGKRRWVYNQRAAHRKADERVIASLSRLSDRGHFAAMLRKARMTGLQRDGVW